MFNLRAACMVVWAILLWLTVVHGMRDSQVKELRYTYPQPSSSAIQIN
jgi:hypothetical protein